MARFTMLELVKVPMSATISGVKFFSTGFGSKTLDHTPLKVRLKCLFRPDF